MDWISVKDRLPEDDENIKFYDNNGLKIAPFLVFDGDIFICPRLKAYQKLNALRLDNINEWIWYQHLWITHWMPLPEPPKEAKKP